MCKLPTGRRSLNFLASYNKLLQGRLCVRAVSFAIMAACARSRALVLWQPNVKSEGEISRGRSTSAIAISIVYMGQFAPKPLKIWQQKAVLRRRLTHSQDRLVFGLFSISSVWRGWCNCAAICVGTLCIALRVSAHFLQAEVVSHAEQKVKLELCRVEGGLVGPRYTIFNF